MLFVLEMVEWNGLKDGDRIAIKSSYDRYLNAREDGIATTKGVAPGSWETWTVEKTRNGQITLKSHHGKYLAADDKGQVTANRVAPGQGGTFTVEKMGEGASFKTFHRTYLYTDNNGFLHAKVESGKDRQFKIERVGGEFNFSLETYLS